MGSPVTIGVAVRYEKPDRLRRFVRQVADAAHLLDAHTESEVCFCLNGASPSTRKYLADALRELPDPELNFACLESAPGKIRAHETIAKLRQLNGFLLFLDADVRFNRELFLRFYRFISDAPQVHACYAEVEALPSVAGGLFARIQNTYYRQRHRLHRRAHLHGRCFMLRNWINEFGAPRSPAVAVIDSSDDKLGLQHGPIVDDIHYSRVLAHRFGREAIAVVPDVQVRFIPPHSLTELYRDSCRTELELRRLEVLFPEHAPVEQGVFSRVSDGDKFWHALRQAGLSTAAYVGIELAMRRLARFKARRRMASLAEGGISPATMVRDEPRVIRESLLD